MAAKAKISSGYRWRLGIIALALLAFGGWFFYDGAVAYPERMRVYQAYQEIQEQYSHDPAEASRQWGELADARGYPDQPTEYTDQDIFIQYLCAALTLPLGLLFGITWLRAGRRWIASDEQGLHTSWGQHASWDSLRSVDKARWKTKGIAVVHYEGGGSPKRITLDDWKYEAEPTAAMLKEVEARLGVTEGDAELANAEASASDANAGSDVGSGESAAPANEQSAQ